MFKRPQLVKNFWLSSFVAALIIASMVANQAKAATVGYWRFEGDATEFLQDSSGNGHDITSGMTAGSNQAAIPGSGNSSAFSNPIPQTYQPNLSTSISGKGTIPYDSSFVTNAFTVEAFVNAPAMPTSGFKKFAAQWDTSGTLRRWAFGKNNGSTRLSLLLNTNGTSGGNSPISAPTSAFNLAANTDYYLAVSYDGSSTTSGNNGVTFYLKNLSTNGPLEIASVDNTLASIFSSTADLSIGGVLGGSTLDWDGSIDEVRFSSGILSVDELLISVGPQPAPIPEPSTLPLAALGMFLFSKRRRSSTLK